MGFMDDLRQQAAIGLLALAAAGGCNHCVTQHGWSKKGPLPPPPLPVGTHNAAIFRIQESNGEASDFVIYEHEFQLQQTRLNYAGEDHVKQVAARLHAGMQFPVIIERSRHTVDPNDKYQFPVHLNPVLDMQRREVVVQCLLAMGVADAEQRVVVAPALTEGYEAFEAQRAYLGGIFGGFGGGGNGGGGGFGGNGRFGGFGF